MKKHLFSFIFFLFFLAPPAFAEEVVVDELYLGDTVSEISHRLSGWSSAFTSNPLYGGINCPSTFRMLMGPGDGCLDTNRSAYFTMSLGDFKPTKLVIEHYDSDWIGSNFDIYALEKKIYKLIGHFVSDGTSNYWTTLPDFELNTGAIDLSQIKRKLTFKLVATGPVNQNCDQYGQIGISQIRLFGE